ncbi:MAG TPA: porin [Gammaproteobacteria bacterium]
MSLKKISGLALAVLTVWLAPHSYAESDFYGRAQISVDLLDDGVDSGANLSSNGSRIGFRTSTELAPNLQGRLQIEQELRYDNGTVDNNTFASRDTYVEMESGFGKLRMGYFNTPLKNIRGEVDFFGDQVGDARNLTRLDQAPYSQDFDSRFRNGIQYSTPEFGAFTLTLHHSTNNTEDSNPPDDAQTANSLALIYRAGDLYIAGGYETHEARNDSDAVRIAAKYKLDALTLIGLFQTANIENMPESEDVDVLGFGASYAWTAQTLFKGHVYSLSADSDEQDARMLALGLDHQMGKQFWLQFVYAGTNNDEFATYRVSAGGHGDKVTPAPGEQAMGLSAGLRYDFD